MSDAPRRPILRLKMPPPGLVSAAPTPAPKADTAPAADRWKCKPCGATVTLTGDEAAADAIRCPACNARLGTAQDFRDGASRVRARRVEG